MQSELWDYNSNKTKFRWSYEPTFRIQSRYRIFPEQTIKAALGTYNLSPKLMAIDKYGNPNLDPARSSQYSIGYQWQISDLLSFDIQGYLNKQWDKAQDVLWKELKEDESRR